MDKKIKAVIIGFSHMHVNEIALYISECEYTELVAVADYEKNGEDVPPYRYTGKWNLANVKEKYCDKVYSDYIEMLDKEKPDIAFIMTENALKPEVACEVAKRGIDLSIEKPVAISLSEAKKIQDSVKKYGVRAFVNWPVAYREYLFKLKKALDDKVVGTPVKLRYINGHTGPLGKGAKHRGVTAQAEEMTDEIRGKTWWHKTALGGGVFLDIACYGCYFSSWIMGDNAREVVAMGDNLATPFGDTADNFGAVIGYEGKMSVIEGTWTTPRAVIPSGPMVICDNGVVACVGGAENAPDVKAYDIYGQEVSLEGVTLPQNYKNMPYMYARHVLFGEEVFEMLTLDKNVKVMALLDACIKSNESGKREKVSD